MQASKCEKAVQLFFLKAIQLNPDCHNRLFLFSFCTPSGDNRWTKGL